RRWVVPALVAALLAATALGYFLFGRPLPSLTPGIVVADYTGMTQAQAQLAVVNAGLRTRFTISASETVAPDHVIRQSPPAGTSVEKNQVVELVVSNGKPLRGLDDVRGYNVNDAQRTLQQAGFAVTIVRRPDNTVKDNVIDQLPKPGAKVREGSRVSLIVSSGPLPVVIPSFVGMTVDKAEARARDLGITLDTTQSVAGTPANTIASQDLAAGTKVDRNATLRVVVNAGTSGASAAPAGNGPVTSLPNVVGSDFETAAQMLTQAGFQLSVQYAQQTSNNGYVIAQSPPAGQQPAGSTVAITLSVSGEVPDTVGMTPVDAIKALRAYGYHVAKFEYTTSAGAGGKVIQTDPIAGTALAPGSSVGVTVNGTPPP
ncbi:MAG: PASTA domain-containing protein, partial [Candidatus Baltobacteraceae bacterium]